MAERPDSAGFGLDTSVVLRLLVGEPADQAETALRFLQRASQTQRPILVSDAVIAETYFALHAHYRIPKRQALSALLDFLRSGQVQAEPGGCAQAALEQTLRSSAKPGFLDRLIHLQYAKHRARLVSFEKAAARLAHALNLEE